MTSASAAASTLARRGRSCRSSSPTPWWVLKVTRRTGIGGWSGPGAGLTSGNSLTPPTLSGGGQLQVGHLAQLVPAVAVRAGAEEPEACLPAVQDQLADR